MKPARRKLIAQQAAGRRRVVGEPLLEVLRELRDIDLVVFTGDVVDWGLAEEYAGALPRLRAILNAVQVPVERFFLVPGNHDVNRERSADAKRAWRELRDIGEHDPFLLSNLMSGLPVPALLSEAHRDLLLSRTESWRSFLVDLGRSDLLPERHKLHGRLGYQARVPIERLPFPVHVVGLDSAWLCGGDDDAGRILVTKGQYVHLTDGNGGELSGLRLALLHHPPSALRDGSELLRQFNYNADLLLHGHVHEPIATDMIDPDRCLRVLAAGSLFEGDHGDQWINGFQVVTLHLEDDGRPVDLELDLWGWSSQGHWHPNGSVYKAARDGQLRWCWSESEWALPSERSTRRLVYGADLTSPNELAGPRGDEAVRQAPCTAAVDAERLRKGKTNDANTQHILRLESRLRQGSGIDVDIELLDRQSDLHLPDPAKAARALQFPGLRPSEGLGNGKGVIDIVVGCSPEDRAALPQVRNAFISQQEGVEIRLTELGPASIQGGANPPDLEACIRKADVVILLTSQTLLESEDCMSQLVAPVISRSVDGRPVFSVLLHPCTTAGTPLKGLRVLPSHGKPVGTWPTPSAAWSNVYQQVMASIRSRVRSTVRMASAGGLPAAAESGTRRDIQGLYVEPCFVGRLGERALLGSWMTDETCRLIAIEARGGFGKSALAAQLVDELENRYDFIFARSLVNQQRPEDVLRECVLFLSSGDAYLHLNGFEALLDCYIELTRKHQCLVILDNFESVLAPGARVGDYKSGFARYQDWLIRTGSNNNRSTMLITTRERVPPFERATAEGPVRRHLLAGFSPEEAIEFVQSIGAVSTADDLTRLQRLVRDWEGNPRFLQLLVNTTNWEGLPIDLQEMIGQHFQRLSEREKAVMLWLAISREPLTVEELGELLLNAPTRTDARNAVESLARRFMVSTYGNSTRLVPTTLEYVTELLVAKVIDELMSKRPDLLHDHALTVTSAKAHVRETQAQLLLDQILVALGKRESEASTRKRLVGILESIRDSARGHTGYCGGNIVNLLARSSGDLRGISFSGLAIRQAYLPTASLAGTDFSHCFFRDTQFMEVFAAVPAFAFDASTDISAMGDARGDLSLRSHEDDRVLATWRGHLDWVRSVAFGDEGRILVSGGDDCRLRVWDVASITELHCFVDPCDWVWTVDCDAGAERFAAGSADRHVYVWNWPEKRLLVRINPGIGPVRVVRFALGGRAVVAGGSSGRIAILDCNEGPPRVTLIHGHGTGVNAIAIHPDGETFASAGDDCTVRLWRLGSGEPLDDLTKVPAQVLALDFSPDGMRLAAGCGDRLARVWDVGRRECVATMEGHQDAITSVSFDRTGKLLGTSSGDHTVRIWESASGRPVKVHCGYTNQLWAVSILPGGSRIFYGGDDGNVRSIHREPETEHVIAFGRHEGPVWSVAATRDGRFVASGGGDGSVKILDLSTNLCRTLRDCHSQRIRSLVWHPTRKLLVTSSQDRSLKCWDGRSGRLVRELEQSPSPIYSISMSADGRWIAAGCEDGAIRIFDFRTGRLAWQHQAHDRFVWSVAFDEVEPLLLSGSEDGTALLWRWDGSEGELLHVLRGHSRWIHCVALSTLAGRAVTGSGDNTACLWDLEALDSPLRILEGHTSWVLSADIDASSDLLATVGQDETVRLWNASAGEALEVFRCPGPYAGMNMRNAKGLDDSTLDTLISLGARR